jgi:predicted nuclease with TOPRIM domain
MTKEEMLILKDTIKDVVSEELSPLRNEISAVSARQDTMEAKQDAMSAKQDAMGVRQDAMEAKLDTMNERLTRVEIKIENEIDRTIRVLGEGIAGLNRKFDECIGLEYRVETLEHKMSAVEYALGKK